MMAQLAANLSMLFTEHTFLERFEAAANAGFKAVEYLFPYDFSATQIKQALDKHQLVQALFNAPPGDWGAGDRGIACLVGREAEFARGIATALSYAQIIGNKRLHVMAGILPESDDYQAARQCYINNLRLAAKAAQKLAITILIEPINNIDMPGYFVSFQEQGAQLIADINEPNVRLQFDCYHCQMMQGDVVNTFKKLHSVIDHVQIAGVPGRHEPNIGELNYHFILNAIDNTGYSGFVGCEYKPLSHTNAGLSWLSQLQQ